MKVFTIYDSKVEAFNTPFYQRTTAEALRSFEKACNDPESTMYQFPEDITLFEIGEWDEDEGKLTPYEAKKSLGLATEYKKHQVKEVN